MLGVGEVRQVHRLELAVTRDDAARRRGLGSHVDRDRQRLLDRVGEATGPGRGEGEPRGPLGLDLRRPADDDRFARVDRHAAREIAGHRHALGPERHVHGRVGLRRVADECAELDRVAHAQRARQCGPQEERLCGEELVGAFADHRVAADGPRLHTPGGEVVGHPHVDARGAVGLRDDLRAPVRGVAEVLAHLLTDEAAAALALPGRLGDDVVPAIDRHSHRRTGRHTQAALEPERPQAIGSALVLQR